jgi:hypothetical protein
MTDRQTPDSGLQKITLGGSHVLAGHKDAYLANQGRILLQELLTGRPLHWLDGFVLFQEWREKGSKGTYARQFAVKISNVKTCLGLLCVEDWEIIRDPRRSGPWRLRVNQAVRHTSAVQEGIRLARAAVAAFGRGDRSAWQLVEKSWRTEALDPLAVSEAIEAAPSPPGDGMGADVRSAILEVIGAREGTLCMAVAKVARQIQHKDSEITLAKAEAVLVRWIRQIVMLRDAKEKLASGVVAKPPRCSEAAKEFVRLVRQYLRRLPEATARDVDEGGADASDRAAEHETSEAWELLRGCSLVVSASEAEVRALEDIYGRIDASERVKEAVQSVLPGFVEALGPDVEASDHLFVRLCRCLRGGVFGKNAGTCVRRVFGGRKQELRGKPAELQHVLAGLPADISEESARGIVEALIDRPVTGDGAAGETIPGPRPEDFPPKLRQYVDKFETFIQDRIHGFEGRDWVFKKVRSFVQQMPSGYFVIRGDPGVGKSAFVAKLVKEWHLPVYHFNIALESRNTRRKFLGNVCATLIAQFGLPYDELPGGFDQDGSFLSQLLAEASRRLGSSEKLIIAIDALDEAEETGGAIANPLCLPTCLPEGVYAVVTARRRKNVLVRASNVMEWTLDPEEPENKEDVRTYVRKHLNEGIRKWMARENYTPDAFVSLMGKKSEGNFMYLRHVVEALSSPKSWLAGFAASQLPTGLRSYYREHWEQMKVLHPASFERTFQVVVCLVGAARRAVSVQQICLWTAMSPARVRQALDAWMEFLRQGEAEGERDCYRLYHTAFLDFLREEVDPDLTTYYTMIVNAIKRRMQGLNGERQE